MNYLYVYDMNKKETGNYYYGARYYDPKISVWLSVDPLANESPNQTSYHFVSNNPIMRIDPDGLTDYSINKRTGNITAVPGTETSEGPDRLIIGRARYNNHGELRNRNYVQVSKAVTSSLDEGQVGRGNLQHLIFSDSEKAQETFEMIGFGVRDIEFGLAEFSDNNGNDFTALYTSHETDRISDGTELIRDFLNEDQGRDLDRLGHIHGNPNFRDNEVGTYGPSPDDERQVEWLRINFPEQTKETEFYIWKFGNEYPYDENGQIK